MEVRGVFYASTNIAAEKEPLLEYWQEIEYCLSAGLAVEIRKISATCVKPVYPSCSQSLTEPKVVSFVSVLCHIAVVSGIKFL